RAWTWQHPATGRSGSPAHPGFDTAYLPLDQPTNGTRAVSIIGVLRDGRRTGAHWVGIDLAAGEHLIRPRGLRLVDHREQIAAPDATWKPATVTAGAVADIAYPALAADGYTVRGDDVLARFDRPTVEQMAADLSVVNTDSMPD